MNHFHIEIKLVFFPNRILPAEGKYADASDYSKSRSKYINATFFPNASFIGKQTTLFEKNYLGMTN